MLEKAVSEAKGAVRMVKINIDENPEIAQQMRIQSIPAVYAFKDGRPVDGFVGAVPESQIKQFVQRLGRRRRGPSPVEQALEQAKAALDAGDAGTASAHLRQMLRTSRDNVAAAAGLARCYADGRRRRAGRQISTALPPEAAKRCRGRSGARGARAGAAGRRMPGRLAELRGRLRADPNDHQARFELAMALFGGGQREEAIDQLLELVQARPQMERGGGAQAAREVLRGAGSDPPADRRRPAPAVLADVRLSRRAWRLRGESLRRA